MTTTQSEQTFPGNIFGGISKSTTQEKDQTLETYLDQASKIVSAVFDEVTKFKGLLPLSSDTQIESHFLNIMTHHMEDLENLIKNIKQYEKNEQDLINAGSLKPGEVDPLSSRIRFFEEIIASIRAYQENKTPRSLSKRKDIINFADDLLIQRLEEDHEKMKVTFSGSLDLDQYTQKPRSFFDR